MSLKNSPSIKDAKIFSLSIHSSWGARLSQMKRIKGRIFIATYSLPDLSYAKKVLTKRPQNIFILAHKKFFERAYAIKQVFPKIKIALREDIHAKFVLIEPKTVWLSSANFGKSNWIEHTIGIYSKEAFEFYKNAFDNLFHHSYLL